MGALSNALSLSFIKSTLNLCITSYTQDFSSLSGEVLFNRDKSQFLKPSFFVYKENKNLFVVIRGSSDDADFQTISRIDEVTNQYGTFTDGIFQASLDVYENAKDLIKNHDGKVFITGHSYGAACTTGLLVILQKEIPDLDVFGIAFAPIPCISDDTAGLIADHLVTFVNRYDAVPTFSISAHAKFLEDRYPYFKYFPENIQLKKLQSIIADFSIEGVPYGKEMRQNFIDMAVFYIPKIRDYLAGIPFNVNHLAGTVYHIGQSPGMKLQETIVDAKKSFAYYSANLYGIADHTPMPYMYSLQQLIEDEEL